jgi:hypothetical protein
MRNLRHFDLCSRRWLRLLALALMLAGAAPLPFAMAASGPASPVFLSNLDDIPLMAGLTERKDLAVSFDKPEGRIVEAQAEGRLSADAVTKFYAATLPQLGWRLQGANNFMRESEELRLTVATVNQRLIVRFALSPRP